MDEHGLGDDVRIPSQEVFWLPLVARVPELLGALAAVLVWFLLWSRPKRSPIRVVEV